MSEYYLRTTLQDDCPQFLREAIIEDMKKKLPPNAVVVYEDFKIAGTNDIVLIYTMRP